MPWCWLQSSLHCSFAPTGCCYRRQRADRSECLPAKRQAAPSNGGYRRIAPICSNCSIGQSGFDPRSCRLDHERPVGTGGRSLRLKRLRRSAELGFGHLQKEGLFGFRWPQTDDMRPSGLTRRRSRGSTGAKTGTTSVGDHIKRRIWLFTLLRCWGLLLRTDSKSLRSKIAQAIWATRLPCVKAARMHSLFLRSSGEPDG